MRLALVAKTGKQPLSLIDHIAADEVIVRHRRIRASHRHAQRANSNLQKLLGLGDYDFEPAGNVSATCDLHQACVAHVVHVVRPIRGVERRISGGRAKGRSTTPCRHQSSHRVELPFSPLLSCGASHSDASRQR